MSAALEMAFSAEPGRKTAYSDDLHWRIVWQQITQRHSQKLSWYCTQHLAEI